MSLEGNNSFDDFVVQVQLQADQYNQALAEIQAKNNALEKSLVKLEGGFEGSNKKNKEAARQIKKSTNEMDKFMLSIRSVVLGLASLGGVSLGAKGLIDLTNNTAKSNFELQSLGRTLNMSVNDIKNLGRAFNSLGGDQDNIVNSMVRVKDEITAFQVEGKSDLLKYFNNLDVAFLKNANSAEDMQEIYLRFADAFKEISESTDDGYNRGLYIAQNYLGINEQNYQVLSKGRAFVQAQISDQKKLYQMSADDLKNSNEITKNWGMIDNYVKSIGDSLGTKLAPTMLSIQETTMHWLKSLEDSEILDDIAKFLSDTEKSLGNIYSNNITGFLDVIDSGKSWYDENITGFLDFIDGAKSAREDTTTLILDAVDSVKNDDGAANKIIRGHGISKEDIESTFTQATGLTWDGKREGEADLLAASKIPVASDILGSDYTDHLVRWGSDSYEEEEEEEEDGISYIQPSILADAVYKGLEKFEGSSRGNLMSTLLGYFDKKNDALKGEFLDIRKQDEVTQSMAVYQEKFDAPDSTKDRAQEAIKYFINKGYTPEQAAGIAGNLYAESGFKLGAEGDKGFKGGSSFGIAQWRESRLSQFEKLYGKHVKDASLHEQLSFVDWELGNTHKSAGNKLKSASTVEDASSIITKFYEIPANADQKALERHKFSRGFYQDYNEGLLMNQQASSGMNVSVGNITIQTSSSTMQGAGVDFANALSSQMMLNQTVGAMV